MRRVLMFAAASAMLASLASATPPSSSVVAECAESASYRRLGGREIEAAVVDRMLVYDWRSGIYRSVRTEQFRRRSPRPNNRYLVRYEGHTSVGSYEIVGDRLCTRQLGETVVLCRRMFRSAACGYALSDPGADYPRYRVRIVDENP